jgi:transcriptional regulator with XRE-family HTH domain
MPDIGKLRILRQLRESRQIRQADAAKLLGLTGRGARNQVSLWENGRVTPPPKHREKFKLYLADAIGLRSDPEMFDKAWQVVCGEWKWLPLTNSERRTLFSEPAVVSDNEAPSPQRMRVYTLPHDEQECRVELRKWSLIPEGQPVDFIDEAISLGDISLATFNRSPLPKLYNCSVECKVKIIDDGGNPDNWVGVKLRGYYTEAEDIGNGYLVHLRSNGIVEIYTRRDPIAISRKMEGRDTQNEWWHIRVDIVESTIQVWINSELLISQIDKTIGVEGYVYVHSHLAKVMLKDFQVYSIAS